MLLISVLKWHTCNRLFNTTEDNDDNIIRMNKTMSQCSKGEQENGGGLKSLHNRFALMHDTE